MPIIAMEDFFINNILPSFRFFVLVLSVCFDLFHRGEVVRARVSQYLAVTVRQKIYIYTNLSYEHWQCCDVVLLHISFVNCNNFSDKLYILKMVRNNTK